MMGLTRRQAEVLAFIRARCAAGIVSPTYQEIADHFGIAKSNVHRMVHALIERGYLRQIHGRQQTIAPVEPGLNGDSEGVLAQLAKRRGVSRDVLIQQAVDEFLDRELRA